MNRSIAILLGITLLTGTGLAYAGKGGGGGGRGGGGFHGGGGTHFSGGARPAPGGFTRFTTGPMRFTTGPHPSHPIAGVRPGPVVIARPGFPHRVVGGTVIVAAPLFYPAYPYAYPYPYVAPVYGGSAYNEELPQYVEQGDAIRYYCPDYQDYYPNVPTCPSQWMQVVPDNGSYSN